MRATKPGIPLPSDGPRPTSVRYNDWRQVELPPPDAFAPTLPVSVIIPSYQTPPETLAMTLAALEGQTYPRDLFEVVIVDDGSEPPLTRPRSTPLNVKVVRQKRRGFGAARARNTGARAAAHDILLFLDSDMLAEAGWMAAHARWHHTVADALTLGFHACAAVGGLDAAIIRCRPGTLRELLSGRLSAPSWIEAHMLRTDDLTSRADDLFRVVISGNFGIRKPFYRLVEGFDESLVRYGLEDIELGYRVYTRGGLLVPVRDAFTCHLDLHEDDRDAKDRSHRIQYRKAAHLIAHRGFRGTKPGRTYQVPQFVVTVDAGHLPAEQVIKIVGVILADRVHDLVVRVETQAGDGHERLVQLRNEFDPDPRVQVAPARSALDEFPVASFHVTLPGGAVFARDLVHRLRARLKSAVTAAAVLPDGSRVSITRAWALQRARRAPGGGDPADYGEARMLSAASLKIRGAVPTRGADCTSSARPADYPGHFERLLYVMRDIRGPGEAYSTLKGLVKAVWGQGSGKLRRQRNTRTGNTVARHRTSE